MKAGAHHWCRVLSLSYPTVWGSFSALFAGPESGGKLGKTNPQHRVFHIPEPSLLSPTSFQCSFAIATPHGALTPLQGQRPPSQGASFTLDRCLPHLHSFRDLSAHMKGLLTLPIPLNLSRAEVLYQTKRDRGSLLVWWIHPA